MANLYSIIDDVRQERPGASTATTLDILSRELGRTQDNLNLALANLADRALPTGGRATLEEVRARAQAASVDEVSVPVPRSESKPNLEGVDGSQIGIAILLGGTALLSVVLAIFVFMQGLNQILHIF